MRFTAVLGAGSRTAGAQRSLTRLSRSGRPDRPAFEERVMMTATDATAELAFAGVAVQAELVQTRRGLVP